MFKTVFLFLIFFVLISCSKLSEEEQVYIQQINDWHKKRIESLTEKDSWLSLAGLFWLKEGENSFGADKTNDIVFPEGKATDFMGWFNLNDGEVKLRVKPGVNITGNDKVISDIIMQNDQTTNPTILKYESLTWFVIKRGEKYGIRLKDNKNPELEAFKGIDRYDVNPGWRIPATFKIYDPVKIIEIPTVLGTVVQDTAPGYLQFEINGKSYQLDPLGSLKSKSLFLIFADQTNGDETYGAGRFLSVDFSHPDSTIYIDFNKAYNPPCAFTKYATCPLPPKQNQLPIEVTAGEKKYGHASH